MLNVFPQFTIKRALATLLLEAGQAHLFEGWEAAGTNDAKKHDFFAQIAKLHATYPYPGGLKAYLGACVACWLVGSLVGGVRVFGSSGAERRGEKRGVGPTKEEAPRTHISPCPQTQTKPKPPPKPPPKPKPERARALLAESAQGVNPLEGWSPEVPQGEILQPGTPRYLEMEALGEAEMGGACVIV